jgi:hypothetical protein
MKNWFRVATFLKITMESEVSIREIKLWWLPCEGRESADVRCRARRGCKELWSIGVAEGACRMDPTRSDAGYSLDPLCT